MANVTFSIITVVYNNETTLVRTIESVLAQTYAPKEYFVIDGASSDHSAEIARGYSLRFKEKGIAYKVISEKDNGMYDALNKGASMATGLLVGQINSDDWYEPDALQAMAELYEKEKFDMAYADLRMIPTDGAPWIKKARVSRFVNTRHWSHPTQFTKREILLKKPYACECMSDDLDLMLWIRSHHYKVVSMNKTLANFTMEGMSHSKSFAAVWDRVKTKTHIYMRNGYSWIHGLDVAVVECGKYLLRR